MMRSVLVQVWCQNLIIIIVHEERNPLSELGNPELHIGR